MSVIVVGQINVDPSRLELFLSEVEAIEKRTREEDGCLLYAMGLDDPATGQFAVVEHWRDEAALRTHLEMDHVKSFIERCGPMITGMTASLFDASNQRSVM
ncbi:MAG: putative quinol monooxygenase [Sphingomonadaceae bacterium]